MTDKPLVSVIVPVWQGEKTLRASVESLLAQSYHNIEILIVDDGSTDGTRDVANRLTSKDARVRVLTQANGGVSSARNLGIDNAHGRYVYFCDCDDWVYPSAIETLAPLMADGCALAVGGYETVVGQKAMPSAQIANHHRLPIESYLGVLCRRANRMYFTALWNKLYDLSIIQEAGLRFDASLCWGEDFTFNMQYLRLIGSVAVTSELVYRYYRSVGGLAVKALFVKREDRVSNIQTKLIMQRELQKTMAAFGLEKKYALYIKSYFVTVTLVD